MEKKYISPEAKNLRFGEADIITSSGELFAWELPMIDLSESDLTFSEDGSVLRL